MGNISHKLEDLFNKLNDNSIVRMETFLIEDLIATDKQNHMDTIYHYLLAIKEKIDRNNLNNANLAKLNALELLFENSNISFKGKTNGYKRIFLKMLQLVLQHQELYVKNNNCRVTASIDPTFDRVRLHYTMDKICERKDQSLAIRNIQDFKNTPLNELQNKLGDYLAIPLFIDPQVAFVLKNYLQGIEVSETYAQDIKNWKHGFVVYGTIPEVEVEQFYALDHSVLDYFNYLMTQRVQQDLDRDDIAVQYIYVDEENKVSLMITKQYAKQKTQNIRNKYLQTK